jgi:uncharacterized protein YigE (DUF2233 family)
MDVWTGDYAHRAPINRARISVARFDTRRFRLRVVRLYAGAGSSSQQAMQQAYLIPSLRRLNDELRPIAAMNGGYVTSYAFPSPTGLVRVNGKSVSAMSTSRLLSGVLCLTPRGQLDILKTTTDPGAKCSDALQSGPLLVEASGKNGIAASEPASRAFDRSVVCVDGSKRALLIRAERTALYDLAQFLLRPSGDGGLGCKVAINLSGDADSGLIWHEGKALKSAGSIDASLATALVVTRAPDEG